MTDSKVAASQFVIELFETIQSLQSWCDLRDGMVLTLKKDVIRNSVSEEESMRMNILLAIVGEEIRNIWKMESAYHPDLLREPYIGGASFIKLKNQLVGEIQASLDNSLVKFHKEIEMIQFRKDLSRIFQESIQSCIATTTEAVLSPGTSDEFQSPSGCLNDEEEIDNPVVIKSREAAVTCNRLSIAMFLFLQKMRDHRTVELSEISGLFPSIESNNSNDNNRNNDNSSDSNNTDITRQESSRKSRSLVRNSTVASDSNLSPSKLRSSRRTSSFDSFRTSMYPGKSFSVASSSTRGSMHMNSNTNGIIDGVTEASAGKTTSIELQLNAATDEDIEEVCSRLNGCLLPSFARCLIWNHRFMLCEQTELISENNHLMDDFRRLALQRGVDINRLHQSPVHELVNRSVFAAVTNSLAHTMKIAARNKESTPSSSSSSASSYAIGQCSNADSIIQTYDLDRLLAGSELSMLPRKCALLVTAAYVLTGIVSDRCVHIALLLLRVFHDDPPICEKILGLWKRLTGSCLPSLILHKPYSVLTVSHTVFQLLKQREPQLFNFLQYEAHFNDLHADVGSSFGSATNSIRGNPAIAGQSLPVAKSYILLRGILETGFIGWLPEHAALYIWDTLAMQGGTPSTFRSILPTICVAILQMCGETLMTCANDIVTEFRRCSQRLRTKLVVANVYAVMSLHHSTSDPV